MMDERTEAVLYRIREIAAYYDIDVNVSEWQQKHTDADSLLVHYLYELMEWVILDAEPRDE